MITDTDNSNLGVSDDMCLKCHCLVHISKLHYIEDLDGYVCTECCAELAFDKFNVSKD